MRQWLRDHKLLFFLILAFPLSWYPWFIALSRGTTSGPNPLGPFVAALIVTATVGGKARVGMLLRTIVRWRVNPLGYIVAMGLPVLLCAVSAGLTVAVGGGSLRIVSVPWQDVLESFIFILLFIGLGEEPGWRGFALPELQRRHTPVIATLILSAIWAVWHLPLIGNEFPIHIVPAFVVSLLGGALVQTWLFNRTESVLLQMLFHATVNTIGAGLVFRWFSGSDVTMLWWINAIVWLIAGVIFSAARRPLPAGDEASATAVSA